MTADPGFWWTARGLKLRSTALLVLAAVILLSTFVAGWAAAGMADAAPLVVAWLLARLVEKPWLVTRLRSPGGPGRLAREMALQVALSLLLFAAGGGLAALIGWHPPVAPLAAAALVLAAAGLSRAIWRPLPPEWDSFMDEAVSELTDMAADLQAQVAGVQPSDESEEAALTWLQEQLDAQPQQDARHHDLVDLVTGAMDQVHPALLADVLLARARACPGDRELRAVTVLVTDPWFSGQTAGRGLPCEVFELIAEGGDPGALSCWLHQVEGLLDLRPEAWRDLPEPQWLRTVSAHTSDPALAADLSTQADRIAALQDGEATP